MTNFSKGIVYVATGLKYLIESVSSARRTKSCCQYPICIFTDLIDEASRYECFDIIQLIDHPLFTYGDKILPLSMSPFDLTLFLDSDAFLLECPSNLFSLLNTLLIKNALTV